MQSIALNDALQVFHLNSGETVALYREIFLDGCYEAAATELRPGDTVLDVGANIGLSALYFHRLCPTLRILCVEPQPLACAVLRANLEKFGVNATALEVAASDASGKLEFVSYPNNTVMSGVHGDPVEDGQVTRRFLQNHGLDDEIIEELLEDRFETQIFTVDAITLSELIDSHGICRVDLLKIDVEKSELRVLDGIEERHWPLVRRIYVEVHNRDGELERLMAMLNARGFVCLASQQPLLEGTGLYDVYARRPEQLV